jgi:hypothetical protein
MLSTLYTHIQQLDCGIALIFFVVPWGAPTNSQRRRELELKVRLEEVAAYEAGHPREFRRVLKRL